MCRTQVCWVLGVWCRVWGGIGPFGATQCGLLERGGVDADEIRPVMSQSGAGRDPPPTWDGEDPSRRWRTMRRDILLWDDDVDLLPRKRGVRLSFGPSLEKLDS